MDEKHESLQETELDAFNRQSVWQLALPVGGDVANFRMPDRVTIVRVDRIQQIEPRKDGGSIVKARGESGGTVVAHVATPPLELARLVESKLEVLCTRGLLGMMVQDGVTEVERLIERRIAAQYGTDEGRKALIGALQELAGRRPESVPNDEGGDAEPAEPADALKRGKKKP